jgi:tetratricopeptide (TPR) repeat protein
LRFETRRLHENRWFIETRDYFHDRRAFRWAGRAHNFVTPTGAVPAPNAALLPRDRLRVAHHTDSTKPRGRQLAGVLLDALKWPRSPSRGFLAGRELAIRGHYQSALAAFLAQDRPEAPSPLRSASLCMAAACLAETVGAGSQDAVAALLFKAARRDPGRRDPWIQLARRGIAAGDFQAAVSFATVALAIPPQLSFAELEENLRDGPHAILYWALFWLGRTKEAAEHLGMCLDLEPLNAVYREHARLLLPSPSG